jgi:hypothetical protein
LVLVREAAGMRLTLPAIFLPLALTACSNGFAKFYHDGLRGKPIEDFPNLIRHDGEPTVTYSRNNEEDHLRLMEDGYVRIGHSAFNGTIEGLDNAKDQGMRVGAAMVLVTEKYRNTVSGTIPFTTYDTVTTQHSGTYMGTYSSGTYSGTSQTQVPRTSHIPYSVDRYDQFATYWVRAKPGVIGLFFRDLTPDGKKALGRNKGVEVIVTVKRLPAYKADIVRGDVIVMLADEEVVDQATFGPLIQKHAGTEVEIGILRDKKEITKRIWLNPLPK